jgi:hypothetical protein
MPLVLPEGTDIEPLVTVPVSADLLRRPAAVRQKIVRREDYEYRPAKPDTSSVRTWRWSTVQRRATTIGCRHYS